MARYLFVLAALFVGCGPPSSGQRLAESASDMNTAARFGRMDIALDYVADAARADFTRRHTAWGGDVRILDVDFVGMAPAGKDDADVFLSISWQNLGDPTVQVTTLAQRWHDDRGWRMVGERRTGGVLGLLADGAKHPPADDKSSEQSARFRTHTIPADE